MTAGIALIRNSLTGLKIRQQDERTLKSSIAVIVQKLFAIAGQSPEKKDVELICKEICADLQKRYKGMTLSEVDYALNAGVRGEYGEYYGINVVTINKWLRAYYNSDERKEAMRSELFPELTLPQHVMTEEERRKVKVEMAVNAWKKAKNGEYVTDYGNVVYDFLAYDRSMVQFSVEEKNGFMIVAKQELENEAKDNAKTYIPVSYLISRITEKGIVSRAKRIALNVFFARMIDKNTDLIDWI
jgi:hypothetical protein